MCVCVCVCVCVKVSGSRVHRIHAYQRGDLSNSGVQVFIILYLSVLVFVGHGGGECFVCIATDTRCDLAK